MAKISETYSFGDQRDIQVADLIEYLEEMYRLLAVAINKKPDVYVRQTDGQTTDIQLSQGDININSSTDKVEMLTNFPTTSTVTWTQLS